MPRVNEAERIAQKRVLRLFKNKALLDYSCYGDLSEKINTNIEAEKLTVWLIGRGYSEGLASKAVFELQRTARNMQQGLYKANQEVYSLLKYGAKVKENPGEPEKTVYFIDWEDYSNNDFAIAEEVTIKDKSERRPDLVIYINGIAVAVIELKKSTVSVSHGIRQSLSNQSEHFNRPFFTTIQLVMAGNTGEGLRYATIETKEKYYLEWKNDILNTEKQPLDDVSADINERCAAISDKLEHQLFSMFHKPRLLDLLYNFVIFDKGVKKVCRHNQFFGIKKAQIRLGKGQGGIIWHTQGSGKTLMMVWLSKWILATRPAARVLIITDRDELDGQMEGVYRGVGEQAYRAASCADLVEKLAGTDKRLICSLIHKFGISKGSEDSDTRREKDAEQFARELGEALPVGFKAKGDFVVFVDECHRTQSGLLHRAMREILPNAVFIGFTGTPLLVRDRKISAEVFAPGYIHTYKYDEAIADGAVLGLRYTARDIDLIITQKDKLNAYFDAKSRGLSDSHKAMLKKKWGSNKGTIVKSRKRFETIAEDIISDFDIKVNLANGNGNAMLVADSVHSACVYYKIFRERGFTKCAMITSFVPLEGKVRTEAEDSAEFEKYTTYKQMLGGRGVEEFEADAKRKFIDEPAQMRLLIVVEKLLTGFNAPPCTFLYIDKVMHDHTLFQAVTRVNRLNGEEKHFGYLVDYRQSFGSLAGAMKKYTSGGFEGYSPEDVDGLVKDYLSEAVKHLENTLSEINGLCSGVNSREEIDYIRFFCGENGVGGIDDEACARRRERLYWLVNRLIRAYAEIKGEMDDAGYTNAEQNEMNRTVRFYTSLKKTIGNSSGDFIDLKAYEADMRRLIDIYVRADGGRVIGEFDDFTLLDFVNKQSSELRGKGSEAAAEAIENNIRKRVNDKAAVNPIYYEEMSVVLDKLIKARRAGAITCEKQVEGYKALADKLEMPENNPRYPKSISSSGALRAFYDNFGGDEELALAIDKAVRESKQADFRQNEIKVRRIKKALYALLEDDSAVEWVYSLAAEQSEY